MKKFAVLGITCMFLLLTACSDKTEDINESTLIFDKEGRITNVIVDSFSEDFYTEEGLNAFLNEKVDDFNDSNDDDAVVTLMDITISDGVARATLLFDNAEVYSKFYKSGTFYGSINDAYDAGYLMDVTLKAVGAPETITKEAIMQRQNDNIIIVSEPILVKSPKKIIYTSANVEIIDDRNVRISSDSVGAAYMLIE